MITKLFKTADTAISIAEDISERAKNWPPCEQTGKILRHVLAYMDMLRHGDAEEIERIFGGIERTGDFETDFGAFMARTGGNLQ